LFIVAIVSSSSFLVPFIWGYVDHDNRHTNLVVIVVVVAILIIVDEIIGYRGMAAIQ